MKKEIYGETTGQLLFTLFDRSVEKKLNKFRIHYHIDTELGYIVSGEGLYRTEHQSYNACGGKMFFIRSNEMHCIHTITTPALYSVNLHITPYYLWSICSDYIEAPVLQTIMQKIPVNHEYTGFDKYFIELKELLYMESSQAVNTAIRRNVLMIIMNLCDIISEEQKTYTAINNKSAALVNLKSIQNAIAYIDSRFYEKIKIEDLVGITHLSRSLFSAEFKSYTGMSAIEYVTIRRIEKAMYLLKNTSMSVSTISQECGFTNLSNFNRLFKKITKITPKEYQKRM